MRYRRRNQGKRERAARSRHKRTITFICVGNGSDPITLKLGAKHLRRSWHRKLSVADSRNASKSKKCD